MTVQDRQRLLWTSPWWFTKDPPPPKKKKQQIKKMVLSLFTAENICLIETSELKKYTVSLLKNVICLCEKQIKSDGCFCCSFVNHQRLVQRRRYRPEPSPRQAFFFEGKS